MTLQVREKICIFDFEANCPFKLINVYKQLRSHLSCHIPTYLCVCVLCHPDLGWGLLGVCVMRLRAPGCGWGAVVVSAAALLLLAALGLALALILTRESLLRLRSVITMKKKYLKLTDRFKTDLVIFVTFTVCAFM